MSRNLHLYIKETSTGKELATIELCQTTSEETEQILSKPDIARAYLSRYPKDRKVVQDAQKIVSLSDGKLTLDWCGW